MDPITFWHWQVKEQSGRWRQLAWRMTVEDAAAWAERNGREMRKVPGSAEIRPAGKPENQLGGMMDKLGTRK